MREAFVLLTIMAAPAIAQSPFASSVIDYSPAAGQFVSDPSFNDPTRALGIPQPGSLSAPSNTSVVTLGGFTGSITLGFDQTVEDDPNNPMSLDAIVFGNAFYLSGDPTRRSTEAATIEIARDTNSNGLADDPFYLIPGSAITAPTSPPHLLDDPAFTADVSINSNTQSEDHWGYADRTPASAPSQPLTHQQLIDYYTTPDDPFTVGITDGSPGGDAFDIAWAIDPATGEPANLPGFDFIRITTAVDVSSGLFGEKSTEIDAVADVSPAATSCPADVNQDGIVNGLDFGAWLGAFNAMDSRADQNNDDLINGLDFGAWLGNFNTGCDG